MWRRLRLTMLTAAGGALILLTAAAPGPSGRRVTTSSGDYEKNPKPPCCRIQDLSAHFSCLNDMGEPYNPYLCGALYLVSRLLCGSDPTTVCSR